MTDDTKPAPATPAPADPALTERLAELLETLRAEGRDLAAIANMHDDDVASGKACGLMEAADSIEGILSALRATPAAADPALEEAIAWAREHAVKQRIIAAHHGDMESDIAADHLDALADAALRATPAAADGGWNAAIEAAAEVCDPGGLPCDCAYETTCDGKPCWIYDCHCSNSGDLARVASWCTEKSRQLAIRALARPQQPPAGTTAEDGR